jgi:flagellar assembly protein FliH
MEEFSVTGPVPEFVQFDAEGSDEFTEGLMADKVEMLVGEGQGEGEGAEALSPSNVLRNEPSPDMEQLLAQAREEAQSIIDEAESRAAGIVSEAEQNAAATLENAKNQGYSAGHDEGYQAGYGEAEALKQQYEGMITDLENEYQAKMDELEPLFVDTLTDIYEHIFHVDLSGSRDVIFHLIGDAVRKIEGNEGFIIHVSKDDYGYISMQRQELLSGVTNSDSVEIVEDMTLKSNECFIETGGGIFDCSLDTQLEGLKRELRLLSYEKPSPGAEENG